MILREPTNAAGFMEGKTIDVEPGAWRASQTSCHCSLIEHSAATHSGAGRWQPTFVNWQYSSRLRVCCDA
jgi:hypothetical protein